MSRGAEVKPHAGDGAGRVPGQAIPLVRRVLFSELELSMNLWGVIAGISRLHDYGDEERRKVVASSKCFRESLKLSSVPCLKRGWLRTTFKPRVNNHSNRASVFVEHLPYVLIRSTC